MVMNAILYHATILQSVEIVMSTINDVSKTNIIALDFYVQQMGCFPNRRSRDYLTVGHTIYHITVSGYTIWIRYIWRQHQVLLLCHFRLVVPCSTWWWGLEVSQQCSSHASWYSLYAQDAFVSSEIVQVHIIVFLSAKILLITQSVYHHSLYSPIRKFWSA